MYGSMGGAGIGKMEPDIVMMLVGPWTPSREPLDRESPRGIP